jgi:5-methylcytosine-specific restriction endonuclease McrA
MPGTWNSGYYYLKHKKSLTFFKLRSIFNIVMSNIAQKLICLSLNRNWNVVGYKTVKDTIIQLCGASIESQPSSVALDINYELDENGNPDFDKPTQITPVTWDEWIKLPIRSWDLTINSVNSEIRVPTVVVATNYTKMPVRMFKGKPTKEALWKRDGGIDQYTGMPLKKEDANIDHVIPSSRGGKDTWTNMVVTSKETNTRKGNRLNEEVGLKLIRKPFAPGPIKVCDLITEAKHADWKHFLAKN